MNDAVYELITGQDAVTRKRVGRTGGDMAVCPFELGLDTAIWMDAVICDYNYVFDPNAHLKRFFGEGVKGEYLFLIDEAHNLVENAAKMYSAKVWQEKKSYG